VETLIIISKIGVLLKTKTNIKRGRKKRLHLYSEIKKIEGIKERVIIQSLLEKIHDEEQSKFEKILKKSYKENRQKKL